MDVLEIDSNNHSGNITNKINKFNHGEVKTDLYIIDQYFLNTFPKEIFKNKNYRWLDPGAGTGNFSLSIFNRLMISLQEEIPISQKRKDHIIQNMLFMVEINSENIEILKNIFGEKANIYHQDFLSFESPYKFDIIVGNPPFNSNGLKKVPTNNSLQKANDGTTIWINFVKCSLDLLKENQYLCMITPIIWLKPDKAKMYDLLTSYKLLNLRCFNNTQTNKMFHGNAQTPTSIFLLQKSPTENILSIYDENNILQKYTLKPNYPIPTMGITIINKMMKFVDLVGNIKVIKTNLPPRHVEIIDKKHPESIYQNITTCILYDNRPKLIFNYSYQPCPYHKKPKLVMAHGMYGFPYLDAEGKYGISNRDKYVILDRTMEDFIKLKAFLSTKFALYLFECTKYRMKYLEKYIFELIPDITKIEGFPEIITDITVQDFFQLTDQEKENINKIHNKDYYSII